MKSVKRTKGSSQRARSAPSAADISEENTVEVLLETWNKAALQARRSWFSKPRLHTAIFEEFLERDLSTDPPDQAFPSPEIKETFYRQRKELIENIENVRTRLGWDEQRLRQFAILAVDFRKDPSIERYLMIRNSFPELDIQIAMSGGIEPLFAIERKCEQYGIDPGLVAGAMDGSEPDIDELCVVLMDRLVAREKIAGVGALQRKRAAISDATVNYLIAFMLEGADWADEEVRLPASLILLIRHQLGALKGDLHKEFRSREMKLNAARIAGRQLNPGERLSITRLMKLTAGVPDLVVSRATAARWLKDSEFKNHLKYSQEQKRSPGIFDLKTSRESHQK